MLVELYSCLINIFHHIYTSTGWLIIADFLSDLQDIIWSLEILFAPLRLPLSMFPKPDIENIISDIPIP